MSVTDATVEQVQPFDVERNCYVRLVGPETKAAARNELGGVVLGGEVIRCSVVTARFYIDSLRGVACDERGVKLEGRDLPVWARGRTTLSAEEASSQTSGQDFRKPALRNGDPIEFVAADEAEGALVTLKLTKVTLTDGHGREYGPGSVIRGRRTDLARYAARGRAEVVEA
ncbi:hypothetical protein [Mobilicoccus pelagius]|uniref:Uncharacterized protein n=1 Tax=Mobilicoccus pelagius NBRC 104925 TaxID=1089455 RepID=H5UNA0_9MICO|nr:hypothetical protein [Mobilicoccus pelagius]GAB47208.1 hypothetical protein MOPEL_007_00250 [Mobilicoccus pelagius NBRC 104925]